MRTTKSSATLKTASRVLGTAVAAGCSGTYACGMSQRYVLGSSAEEIQSGLGRPDGAGESGPHKPGRPSKQKTPDPDNFNRQVEKTTVTFERKDGKLAGVGAIDG